MFTDLAYNEPREGEYNGIRFVFVSGSGILDEAGYCTIEVGIITVDCSDYFITLNFGTPDAEETHFDALEFIAGFLKKL